MADEIQRLILEVQGRDKLEQLNAELKKEDDSLKELAQQLRTGAIAQAQFDAAARQSAGEVLRLQQEIKALAGSGGIGGGGILQASYAVQDFTSVLAGGQGLDRALGAVQNNIPGLLMSLGMSGGIAGAVSLLSVGIGALIPLVEKMWGSLDNKEAAQNARERLRELQQQIQETHKAFMQLQNAPTDAERLSAEGIGMFLRRRPNADKARDAVAAGLTRKEVTDALPGDLKLALAHAESEAGMSDKELEGQAQEAARKAFAAAGGEGIDVPQEYFDRALKERQEFRRRAREQADQIVGAARRNRAEGIVTGATRAGPAGAADRQRLLDVTRDRPEFRELQAMTPERIAADEAEYQAQLERDEEEAEQNRQRREKRREARQAEVRQKQLEIQGRENERRMVRRLEHEGQQEGKAAEADMHRRAAAEERRQREEPLRRARGDVLRMAQQLDPGHSPTAEQADEMANQMMRLMADGMTRQQAAWGAVVAKMQQIGAAMARFQQQQQQMQAQAMQMNMGADYSGVFTPFPPF